MTKSNVMVEIYVSLIKKGAKKIEEVPVKLQQEVKAQLDAYGE